MAFGLRGALHAPWDGVLRFIYLFIFGAVLSYHVLIVRDNVLLHLFTGAFVP